MDREEAILFARFLKFIFLPGVNLPFAKECSYESPAILVTILCQTLISIVLFCAGSLCFPRGLKKERREKAMEYFTKQGSWVTPAFSASFPIYH